ncbi:MAG: Ni/Fe-hydrogenase 1 b-type cytochrome subunit [Gammaproteobacteria bacterium]|jgi:cytochrome b|nr:Ni/Fe-hydrogenase 1 b-type cytochrome subunit [Gammaproteobacteria bacterium]
MSAVWGTQSRVVLQVGTRPVLRVWDGATRLVHWLLVALVGLSWWTASHHRMNYHRYSGYALLGVLAFRLYWGVFGSTTARFAHFVKGPRSIWRYLRSRALKAAPGHNPLGALSVLALLGLLLGQVTLGLFCVDVDGLESGPLSHWVTFETGRACARLHRIGFDVLKVLILLHIVAVLLYWVFKRDNLIRPMITGSKGWSHGPLPRIEFAPRWHAVLGIALAALLVWYVA